MVSSLLTQLPVALATKLIHPGLHPAKQLFRGGCRNPRPPKVSNLSLLQEYLAAHTLDLSAYSRKFMEASLADKNIRRTNGQAARVGVFRRMNTPMSEPTS
jgi:hypothetical protein